MKRWISFHLAEIFIVTAIVSILGATGWGVYVDSKRPTFELRKEDWECVKSELRPQMRAFPIGKTVVASEILVSVCVEYKRRG